MMGLRALAPLSTTLTSYVQHLLPHLLVLVLFLSSFPLFLLFFLLLFLLFLFLFNNSTADPPLLVHTHFLWAVWSSVL